jgi:hypothetical protein
MHIPTLRNAAVAFAAAVCCGAAAQDLPKAETILDKYVEVTGGRAAYLKIHNEVGTGTMEMAANGIHGSLKSWHAEPDKSLTEIDIEGIGKMREGTNGAVAWSLSAIQGPHVKEGDEKAEALRGAKFHTDLNWRDAYSKVETTGVESVEGKDCYKVVLTPKQGNPQTRFYDKQSGLLTKATAVVKTAMGEIPVESVMGDYRKDGDILSPHKVTQQAAGQSVVITLSKMEYNVEIPPDKFDVPAEVKAVMEKK